MIPEQKNGQAIGNASANEQDEQLKRDKLWAKIKLLQIEEKRLQEELEVSWDKRKFRNQLIIALTIVSVLWLLFTGYIIRCLAFGHYDCVPTCQLSDTVATVFITSSLATVLGLWAIGLGYFFAHEHRGRSAASSHEKTKPF